nr:MAG TPA: TM1 SecD export protein N-terminal TM region [Bacteriophage sp.]
MQPGRRWRLLLYSMMLLISFLFARVFTYQACYTNY